MLFTFLRQRSRYFYVKVIALAIFNSILYSSILLLINSTLSHKPLPLIKGYEWQVFAVLILASLFSNGQFQSYMIRLTNDILLEFELGLLQKLRLATYQAFEKLGVQKVYAAIGDARLIGQVPEAMVSVLNAAVVLVCGVVYIFCLSLTGGFSVLLLMGLLLLFYMVRSRKIEKELNRLRDLQEDYHEYLKDLLLGFRELKMSSVRNERLFSGWLNRNRQQSKDIGNSSMTRYMQNELAGTHSWYVVLGVAIFALPLITRLRVGDVSAYVVTILYLMGPVAVLIINIPLYSRVRIALERLDDLDREIGECDRDDLRQVARSPAPPSFSTIRFEDVEFEYKDDEGLPSFRCGPLNFELGKGEMIFITGGNGSGKSTFINLLTGLYRPSSGTIYLDGEPVTHANYGAYTSLIAAVFTNCFLFRNNYNGWDLSGDNQRLDEYIRLMRMEEVLHRPADERKAFDCTALSKGQQKRLALIYALMEDRPLIVLDEWAAEQDPEFRACFYREVLPYLKNCGKTIVAVTHDDFFFNTCDRSLKFYIGRIAEQRLVSEPGLV